MGTDEIRLLKQILNEKQHQLKQQHQAIKDRVARADTLQHEVEQLAKKLDELERPSVDPVIRVSDHARVRFIERVIGISREQLEDRILPKDVQFLLEGLNYADGSYPHPENCRLVIKDKTVVTVKT